MLEERGINILAKNFDDIKDKGNGILKNKKLRKQVGPRVLAYVQRSPKS